MKQILLAVAACLVLTACGDYGSGEKIGTFVKLKQEGFFCKTWEAEIVRGGMNGGSGVMGQPFDVTIEDPSLISKVKDLMESQSEVKITYHTEINTFCRSQSGDNFLTSIAPQGRTETAIKADVAGNIGVAPVKASKLTPTSSQDQDIKALLKVQAELIQKLADKQ